MEERNFDSQQQIAALRHISIFSKVGIEVLEAIAQALQVERCKTNTLIFRKGDEGSSLYIILKGKVKVHDLDHVFAELGENNVFGEYALLDTDVRSASITTIEESVLLRLDQSDFFRLLDNNIQVLKGIMKELTYRLRQRNELEEKLAVEKKRVEEKSREIEQQNALLNYRNEQIMASIQYARRIQTVILPRIEQLKSAFDDVFVLFQPRDIVSGDFYWFHQTADKLFLATADCTGHGVPGALMTMSGANLLFQIVKDNHVHEPEQVLARLHQGIIGLLGGHDSAVQDGMDIAFCVIDLNKKTLEYAGARSPLYYFYQNELQVINADRHPIGGTRESLTANRVYVRHTIPLDKGQSFYIFSDGFQDQFSHDGKKFLRKRFRDLIISVAHLPMAEQQGIMKDALDNWMGQGEQTDDILVIGFRVE